MIPFSQEHFGVDEAGRGSWAGPLVVAACYFPMPLSVPAGIFLRDSKQMSPAQRDRAFEFLQQNCIYSIASVPAGHISATSIQVATQDAMHQCIIQITRSIAEKCDGRKAGCLVDGRFLFELPHQPTFVVRGDATYEVIAAASIIAKVTRDSYMKTMAETYPEYGFELHKGYGTALHFERMKKFGLTPLHRTSYQPMKQLLESGIL